MSYGEIAGRGIVGDPPPVTVNATYHDADDAEVSGHQKHKIPLVKVVGILLAGIVGGVTLSLWLFFGQPNLVRFFQ